MAASSTTGIGPGAADKNAPPLVKNNRLVGPEGPKILMMGRDVLSGGTHTVNHPPVDQTKTLIFVTSAGSNPVRVHAYNNNMFEVTGTGGDTFYWMIVESDIIHEP